MTTAKMTQCEMKTEEKTLQGRIVSADIVRSPAGLSFNRVRVEFSGVRGTHDNKPWRSEFDISNDDMAALTAVFGADHSVWPGKRVNVNGLSVRPRGASKVAE
jgi:hypothetical protein